MSNVVQLTISRQPNPKLAYAKSTQAIIIEPLDRSGTTKALLKGDGTNSLAAASRLLPMRLLHSLADSLTLPASKKTSTAKEIPDQSEQQFSTLYTSLHRAYTDGNAARIESLASAHLAAHGVAAQNGFDPFTQAIYRFFQAKGCDATERELRNFIGQWSNEELTDYFGKSEQLISNLKAQALAAMVNGTLSNMTFDIIFLIKAIIACQIPASAILNEREKHPIPVKLICAILSLPVTFPEWCFDIDPCDWHRESSQAAQPRAEEMSPLKKRLEKLSPKPILNAALAKPNPGSDPDKDLPSRADLGGLILDKKDLCSCDGDIEAPCLPPDPCCAKINYYVTDTLVLRDKTIRYLPSDLAYIENIAIGEKRLREHTFVRTVEDFTEEEVTTTKSEERDHQVTEKSSVQSEIEKNLKLSADVSAKYDAKAYSLTANASMSKDTVQKEAREQVREAVDKAVSKLQVETRKLTSQRVTTREEEKNAHEFNNVGSSKHVVAKYFYVSKEVEGQVFSYGARTTVELLFPSPAALYEHLEKVKLIRGFKMKKPNFPALPASWKDVKPSKSDYYSSNYKLEQMAEPPQPLQGKWETVTYQGGGDGAQPIQIPDGYTLTKIRINGDPDLGFNGNQGGQIAIGVGGQDVYFAHWRKGDDRFERVFEKDVSAQGPTTDATVSVTAGVKSYILSHSRPIASPERSGRLELSLNLRRFGVL